MALVKDFDYPDYKEVKATTMRGKRREANILPLLRVGQIKKDENHLFRLPADVVQGRNSLFDDFNDVYSGDVEIICCKIVCLEYCAINT